MRADYYYQILYPLQDKAIKTFKGSYFYLTGGTALSRIYYNHRFSDDLDYFANYLSDFEKLCQIQINKLSQTFDDVEVDYKSEHFYRIFVSARRLKIELVNDVPAHIGTLIEHPQFGIIDSKENILTNKITAVIDRIMPKDIVDIYFLLKDGVSLKQALIDVHSKAAGIAPLYVAKIIGEFDYSLLDTEIKWIHPVDSKTIKEFLHNVSLSIVKGTL